mmetsp:Transcript_35466/g.63382  ORF Transcript_35466/g.63382 Transcript_35466/m.63382 type:complete len:91 (-) Transcript_35466:26-298(-)
MCIVRAVSGVQAVSSSSDGNIASTTRAGLEPFQPRQHFGTQLIHHASRPGSTPKTPPQELDPISRSHRTSVPKIPANYFPNFTALSMIYS